MEGMGIERLYGSSCSESKALQVIFRRQVFPSSASTQNLWYDVYRLPQSNRRPILLGLNDIVFLQYRLLRFSMRHLPADGAIRNQMRLYLPLPPHPRLLESPDLKERKCIPFLPTMQL